MALQAVNDVWWPRPFHDLGNVTAFTVSNTLNTNGFKFAWMGRVWNPTRSNKSIRKVHFMCGTVVSGNGSTMRVSLQAIGTTNSAPMTPSGTQLETVDTAITGFTTGTWFTSANLSADHAANFGDLLSVVIEFQSFGSGDSIILQNVGYSAQAAAFNQSGCAFWNGSSWSVSAVVPDLMLEFSDGTFGALTATTLPLKAITGQTFNSTSNPEEYGLKFQVPFKCNMDGIWTMINPQAATRTFSMNLYDNTGTLLQTVACDPHQMMDPTSARVYTVAIPETTLTPATNYYVTTKATQSSDVKLIIGTYQSTSYNTISPYGTTGVLSTRHSSAFTDDATGKIPFMGIRISALDDGVNSGGGGIIYA